MQAGREELEVLFLGTGAALPSKYRNVTATYLNMFDKVMAERSPTALPAKNGLCRGDETPIDMTVFPPWGRTQLHSQWLVTSQSLAPCVV